MPDPLAIWTVYDHPVDYPNDYVARLYEATGTGVVATDSVIIASTLDLLREVLRIDMGLTRLHRSPDDDPKIVECWL